MIREPQIWKALQREALDDGETVIKRLILFPNFEKLMEKFNTSYREGNPIVSDWFYDNIALEALRRKNPDHAFFKKPEPEPELIAGKTVRLPQRMLSTQKAYSIDEIKKWADEVLSVGASLGIASGNVFFRITPKYDGYAALFHQGKLYTRGDGRSGTDISHVLKRIDRTEFLDGPGEIVIRKEYFKNHLSESFENSRNFIATLIKEGEVDKGVMDAILSGATSFQSFADSASWMADVVGVIDDLESYWNWAKDCKFDTDGLVIEAVDENIKKRMGSTNHHHRWQIAYKKNEEYHDIRVTGLTWQTSKNGRLTPVVELEPTKVSGVTISRATGHHAGNIIDKGIDTDAIVKVCRSGLVIPYIESVVEKVFAVKIPRTCPSCNAPAKLDGDNLLCTNVPTSCPAQVEGVIEFFFQTIGNCDGFGPKVVEQLASYGRKSVANIYSLTREDLAKIIGGKLGENLYDELIASTKRPIEDWRFLAAFSIHNVGKGGCEKLLKHHKLKNVFSLTVDDIIKVDGLGEGKAKSLVKSLANIKPQFDALVDRFMLIETPRGQVIESPIAGKIVVFTGSMQKGSRSDMEAHAKSLGAKVSGSVSAKTDYLVCGANVGASKTDAAKKNGTAILSEDDYLKLVS